jgi:hypothetical protein
MIKFRIWWKRHRAKVLSRHTNGVTVSAWWGNAKLGSYTRGKEERER